MTATFNHMGIQCVTKKEIEAELKVRKSIKVDPFFQGFDSNNVTFNLNKLRLAFQVFLMPPQAGTYPVPDIQVSRIIMDKKSHGDLQIINYSDNESPFEGESSLINVLTTALVPVWYKIVIIFQLGLKSQNCICSAI